MRQHGDPDQVDPRVDADKVIHIAWDPSIPGGYYGTNKGGQGNSRPGQYCRTYLDQAQAALRDGHQETMPSIAEEAAFSACMRANGVSDFPDPGPSGTLSINLGAGGDLNPNNPTFAAAAKLRGQKTGLHAFGGGTPPPGTIALDGGPGPGG